MSPTVFNRGPFWNARNKHRQPLIVGRCFATKTWTQPWSGRQGRVVQSQPRHSHLFIYHVGNKWINSIRGGTLHSFASYVAKTSAFDRTRCVTFFSPNLISIKNETRSRKVTTVGNTCVQKEEEKDFILTSRCSLLVLSFIPTLLRRTLDLPQIENRHDGSESENHCIQYRHGCPYRPPCNSTLTGTLLI